MAAQLTAKIHPIVYLISAQGVIENVKVNITRECKSTDLPTPGEADFCYRYEHPSNSAACLVSLLNQN